MFLSFQIVWSSNIYTKNETKVRIKTKYINKKIILFRNIYIFSTYSEQHNCIFIIYSLLAWKSTKTLNLSTLIGNNTFKGNSYKHYVLTRIFKTYFFYVQESWVFRIISSFLLVNKNLIFLIFHQSTCGKTEASFMKGMLNYT